MPLHIVLANVALTDFGEMARSGKNPSVVIFAGRFGYHFKPKSMDNHFALTDTEFANRFSDCSLDASLFTHEAHLRLAWIHIKAGGLEAAIDTIRQQLQRYVAQLGASDKYNETVTVAAIKAVHHFMARSATGNFKDFIEENPRLKFNFKELLSAHYHTNIFASGEARIRFMEPELLPFD